MTSPSADIEAIEAVIDSLFASLCWDETNPPDWSRFRENLVTEAIFLPSARPVKPTTMEPFIAMMQGQRDSDAMKTFDEQLTGHQIHVFGNIAVALSAYTQQVNGGGINRGVNAFLLVHEQDGWKIGGMSWDNASDEKPVPPALLEGK